MAKIKVAFFAEILIEDFDGAARTMFQILNRIPHDQYSFLFFCGMGPQTIHGYECITLPTITTPVNTDYKMVVPQLALSKIKAKLANFQPDVIHIATPSLLGSFAAGYAVRRHIPVITIYHTHFISYIQYYFKRLPFLIRPVERQVAKSNRSFYNKCKLVYVPSQSIAGELAQMGVAPSRMKIWKRGIDRNLFAPQKRDVNAIRQLTGNSKPVIIFASRLVHEKNLVTVFAIYDILQQMGMPYNLLLAGDGVAYDECRQRMPGAVFAGRVDHQTLARLYASSDVFVFPSISETIGNVVLEAMASGLPCVIADGGGSRDFITQGVNGFKCPPNDANAYVEKIRQLLSQPGVHQSVRQAGLQYSSAFNWSDLVGTYFNDVRELALQNYIAHG